MVPVDAEVLRVRDLYGDGLRNGWVYIYVGQPILKELIFFL